MSNKKAQVSLSKKAIDKIKTMGHQIKPAVYIGVSLRLHDPTRPINSVDDLCDAQDPKECQGMCNYALFLHDGFYALESFVEDCGAPHNFEDRLFDHITQFAEEHKIVLVAFDARMPVSSELKKRLWTQYDALPATVHIQNGHSNLEEIACSAVRKTVHLMAPASPIPTLTGVEVGYRNLVEVDGAGSFQLTCLDDYEKTLPERDWQELLCLTEELKQRNLKVMFINSTPRGGGVALMRHAMIRLFRLLGLQIEWYVMKPDPRVFEVTKKKYHNVLQAVAHDPLTREDKALYENWCQRNVEKQWLSGPIKDADMIVIDDPQPVGIVPIIREAFPNKVVIYRNHIQMDHHEVDTPGTVARQTFDYLYDNFIKLCDTVVNHPVELPMKLLNHPHRVVMPATTDPFDGLNKDLPPGCMDYYYEHFAHLCRDANQPVPSRESDWITQVARFDPSKGILDVIKAFTQVAADHNVHLVITGHGSIDDPESSKIYHEVQTVVRLLPNDMHQKITVLRLPPSDQLLNFILRQSKIALQLSHKEGFEVKVTEAVMKGKPVIAYRTGGIPLQVEDGVTGFLVTPRDVDEVVARLKMLLEDDQLYREMSEACLKSSSLYHRYLTTSNCLRWLRLFKCLVDSSHT